MENKDRSEMEIKRLKENYETLRKKYGLPDFKVLNENFEIENVSIYDTELLLKKIRKQMMEKVYSYLRMFETFLNPSSAPLFILNLIKSFNSEDKELLGKLYKQLGEIEVSSFELEVIYDEKREADFVNKIYTSWMNMSKDILNLTSFIRKSYNPDIGKQNKSYFG